MLFWQMRLISPSSLYGCDRFGRLVFLVVAMVGCVVVVAVVVFVAVVLVGCPVHPWKEGPDRRIVPPAESAAEKRVPRPIP